MPVFVIYTYRYNITNMNLTAQNYYKHLMYASKKLQFLCIFYLYERKQTPRYTVPSVGTKGILCRKRQEKGKKIIQIRHSVCLWRITTRDASSPIHSIILYFFLILLLLVESTCSGFAETGVADVNYFLYFCTLICVYAHIRETYCFVGGYALGITRVCADGNDLNDLPSADLPHPSRGGACGSGGKRRP